MSRTETKTETVRNFIDENNFEMMQTFNTRNISGDHMENILCYNGVMIDICYDYNYLEIFGLTDAEYESLSDILYLC